MILCVLLLVIHNYLYSYFCTVYIETCIAYNTTHAKHNYIICCIYSFWCAMSFIWQTSPGCLHLVSSQPDQNKVTNGMLVDMCSNSVCGYVHVSVYSATICWVDITCVETYLYFSSFLYRQSELVGSYTTGQPCPDSPTNRNHVKGIGMQVPTTEETIVLYAAHI